MLTEQDYRELLQELGFELANVNPLEGPVGRSLRHTIRRFRHTEIPGRPASAADAFWPSLWWKENEGFVYFTTAERDQRQFNAMFWMPAPTSSVLQDDQTAHCFVPVQSTRSGLRLALQSLFLAQPDW